MARRFQIVWAWIPGLFDMLSPFNLLIEKFIGLFIERCLPGNVSFMTDRLKYEVWTDNKYKSIVLVVNSYDQTGDLRDEIVYEVFVTWGQ